MGRKKIEDKKQKRRSWKIPGHPKYKIWFESKQLIDMALIDHSELGKERLANRLRYQ